MAQHRRANLRIFAAATAFAGLSLLPEINSCLAHGAGGCQSDLNGDGFVDGGDLVALLAHWGEADSDGTVDAVGLAELLAAWGACPPPLPWATIIEAAVDPAVVTSPALRAAITATGLPWRVRDNASNIEMLLVPPGVFNMGCSQSYATVCAGNENPVHQVTLTNAFYIGKTEVTQAQWTAEMGSNPSSFAGYSDSPSRPVNNVSWNTVQSFLTQNSLRLPTEAEWEYAYRAGTVTAFHSSPEFPDGTDNDFALNAIAWSSGNAGSQTHAVAGLAANGFGLHDMAGNVLEWVNDRFGAYPSGSVTNPEGATSGSYRVNRGGGWNTYYGDCRASYRYLGAQVDAFTYVGFRVVRTP